MRRLFLLVVLEDVGLRQGTGNKDQSCLTIGLAQLSKIDPGDLEAVGVDDETQ
jgi:hypothetical protein